MTGKAIKAPFPWFGGKSQVAAEVWRRLGPVDNYVEPFAGSAAMLLARPGGAPKRGTETINDADALLANFWRSMALQPADVRRHADWPVNEVDKHARHLWLLGQRERIADRMMADPMFCDPQAAGWWVWGVALWIGGGWCSGAGSWVAAEDGSGLVKLDAPSGRPGIKRQMPNLSSGGLGVHGRSGVALLDPVAKRTRRVRVLCGDWARLTGMVLRPFGSKVQVEGGNQVAGIYLDPPYGEGWDGVYAGSSGLAEESGIAADVWRWAVENGDTPWLRIAVSGYDDGRELPPGWTAYRWKGHGGYGRRTEENTNNRRETVWFSPHCLAGQAQLGLGL